MNLFIHLLMLLALAFLHDATFAEYGRRRELLRQFQAIDAVPPSTKKFKKFSKPGVAIVTLGSDLLSENKKRQKELKRRLLLRSPKYEYRITRLKTHDIKLKNKP